MSMWMILRGVMVGMACKRQPENGIYLGFQAALVVIQSEVHYRGGRAIEHSAF